MDKRPALGHGLRGLIEGLVAEIHRRTGLACEWNPILVHFQAPTVVLAPEALEFAQERELLLEGLWRYSARLGLRVALTGQGPGDGEFLAEMLEASFRLGLALSEPWSFPLGGGISATFSAERTTKGRFFALEEEAEGPFLYEEVWEGALIFPVPVEREARGLKRLAPGWPIEIQTGGA